jgi:uncharacterized protein YbaR (Trm112 family)
MKKTKWPGNWKFACHRCGFWYPSSEVKKEWTGLLVCPSCYEPKHPQLMIKVRAETAVPDYVSKDGDPTFTTYCDINGVSSFADMATADCAIVGRISPSYEALLDTLTNGH